MPNWMELIVVLVVLQSCCAATIPLIGRGASSTASTSQTAAQAVDDNSNTMWQSLNANPQWLVFELGQYVAPRTEECSSAGVTYTSPSGSFTDGSSPSSKYSYYATCRWRIESPRKQKLEVEFTAFVTEKGYDYVYIGECGDSQPPWYSGNYDQRPPKKEYDCVQVEFRSDRNYQFTGFTAKWRTVGQDGAVWDVSGVSLQTPSSGIPQSVSLQRCTDGASCNNRVEVVPSHALSSSQTNHIIPLPSNRDIAGRFFRLDFEGLHSGTQMRVVEVDMEGTDAPLFKCRDGSEVPSDSVCDGVDDCDSDECDCGSGFICQSALCIDQQFVCDGTADSACGDDEVGCGTLVADATMRMNEGGTSSVNLKLSRAPGTGRTVDITFTVSLGGSYSSNVQVTLSQSSFDASNWDSGIDATISSQEDMVDTDDRTYELTFTGTSDDIYFQHLSPHVLTVVVQESTTAGSTFTPTSASVDKGEQHTMSFALLTIPQQQVDVAFVASSGDVPVSVAPASATILPSAAITDLTVTVTITTSSDYFNNGPHSLTLTATMTSSDAKYDRTTAQAALTVNDVFASGILVDDQPSESHGVVLTLAEGGMVPYTFQMTSAPTSDLTITVSTSAAQGVSCLLAPARGAAAKPSIDFSVTPSYVPNDAGGVFTVWVRSWHDSVDRDDEQCQVSHVLQSADASYSAVTIADVQVTIVDDDTAGVSVQPTAIGMPTLNSTGTYTIRLLSKPTAAVTIDISGNLVTVDPAQVTISPNGWNTPRPVNVQVSRGVVLWTLSHVVSSSDDKYVAMSVNDVEVSIGCSKYGTCGTWLSSDGVEILHGECDPSPVGDQLCTCADGYTGGVCETCAAGYTRVVESGRLSSEFECSSTPDCHGNGVPSALVKGVCDCFRSDAQGFFDGVLCDTCLAGYTNTTSGIQCQPCPGVNQPNGACGEEVQAGVCVQAVCECQPGYAGTACQDAFITFIDAVTMNPTGKLNTTRPEIRTEGTFLTFGNRHPSGTVRAFIRDSAALGTRQEITDVVVHTSRNFEFLAPGYDTSFLSATVDGLAMQFWLEAFTSPSAPQPDESSNRVNFRLACLQHEYDFPTCVYCNDKATCGGRGTCNVAGRCECSTQFSGATCERCTNPAYDIATNPQCSYNQAPAVISLKWNPSLATTEGGAALLVFGSGFGPATLECAEQRRVFLTKNSRSGECGDVLLSDDGISLSCSVPEAWGTGWHVVVEVCGTASVPSEDTFDYLPPVVISYQAIANSTYSDTEIEIKGSEFGPQQAFDDGDVSVLVHDVPCLRTSYVSHQALRCVVSPLGVGKDNQVFVLVGGQTSCNEQLFQCPTYTYPRPEVHSIVVANGTHKSTAGDTWVTIVGQHFGGENTGGKVSAEFHSVLGQVPCLETRWVSSTEVACRSPPGAGVSARVMVVAGNQASLDTDSLFDYDRPEVLRVALKQVTAQNDTVSLSNPTTGGGTIVIEGKNFGSATADLPNAADRVSLSVTLVDQKRPGVTYQCEQTRWSVDAQSELDVLECVATEGSGGQLGVQVTVNGQISDVDWNMPAALMSYDQPLFTEVQPAFLLNDLDEPMTLVGDNFGSDAELIEVFIADQPCTELRLLDAHSHIQCRAPGVTRAKITSVRVVVNGVVGEFPYEVKWQTLTDNSRRSLRAWVIFCVSVALLLWLALFVFREKKVIKASSPLFLSWIIMGGILAMVSVLFSESRSSPTCHFNYFFLSIGFVMLYGALVVKNWRVLRIFNREMKQIKITNVILLKYLMVMIVVDLAFLFPFAAVTGCFSISEAGAAGSATILLLVAYQAALLLGGVFLAFRCRVITQALFNERVSIGYATYNITFSAIVISTIAATFASDYQAVRIIQGLAVPMVVLITFGFLFSSKFFTIYQEWSHAQEQNKSNKVSSHNSYYKPVRSPPSTPYFSTGSQASGATYSSPAPQSVESVQLESPRGHEAGQVPIMQPPLVPPPPPSQ